jgi:hypothetical protein
LDPIAAGKIAETWNRSDVLGLLRQLGAFPPPQTEAGMWCPM